MMENEKKQKQIMREELEMEATEDITEILYGALYLRENDTKQNTCCM